MDFFNFNYSMFVGFGDEYNVICDLIDISYEWELVLERISLLFWVVFFVYIELFFYLIGI